MDGKRKYEKKKKSWTELQYSVFMMYLHTRIQEIHGTVKPALVTTCLQRPHFLFFSLKLVSHRNMY